MYVQAHFRAGGKRLMYKISFLKTQNALTFHNACGLGLFVKSSLVQFGIPKCINVL